MNRHNEQIPHISPGFAERILLESYERMLDTVGYSPSNEKFSLQLIGKSANPEFSNSIGVLGWHDRDERLETEDIFREIWSPFPTTADNSIHLQPLFPEATESRGEVRGGLNINEQDFLVLSYCDLTYPLEYANPDAVIRTVQLSAKSQPVRLVLIVQNPMRNPVAFLALKKNALSAGTLVLSEDLGLEAFTNIVNASDALLSLHRYDPLPLPLILASSLGVPVISSNLSGAEIPGDIGYPVRFDYYRLMHDLPPYQCGEMFSDPSVEHAWQLLLEAITQPEEAIRRALIAREALEKAFPDAAVFQLLRDRLDILQPLDLTTTASESITPREELPDLESHVLETPRVHQEEIVQAIEQEEPPAIQQHHEPESSLLVQQKVSHSNGKESDQANSEHPVIEEGRDDRYGMRHWQGMEIVIEAPIDEPVAVLPVVEQPSPTIAILGEILEPESITATPEIFQPPIPLEKPESQFVPAPEPLVAQSKPPSIERVLADPPSPPPPVIQESQEAFIEHQESGEVTGRSYVEGTRALLEKLTPEGTTVVVVSGGNEDILQLHGRIGLHFPQSPAGDYHPFLPDNSSRALAGILSLRSQGAEYLFFPTASLWWMHHYSDLEQLLDSKLDRLDDDGSYRLYRMKREDNQAKQEPPKTHRPWLSLFKKPRQAA